MFLTYQKKPRVRLIQRKFAIGIGFIVLQINIVAGQVGLDQLLFQDQGFRFGIGDDQRNIPNQGNHDLDANVM